MTGTAPSRLQGFAALTYGVACYLVFLATFVYAIGFVGNLVVPKSVDTGPAAAPVKAVAVDLALLGLFAGQHSVMARPRFKRRFAPRFPVERSTYILASSLALIVLFWLWRPLPGLAWDVRAPAATTALLALFGIGWAVALIATFQIDHFDLFGLKQVVLYAQGRPYSPPLRSPPLYRVVRHPIMFGFAVAFWATPVMTHGHLLFAVATTGYIVIGIWLEERDLAGVYGTAYADYRHRVPMLLPWPRP